MSGLKTNEARVGNGGADSFGRPIYRMGVEEAFRNPAKLVQMGVEVDFGMPCPSVRDVWECCLQDCA